MLSRFGCNGAARHSRLYAIAGRREGVASGLAQSRETNPWLLLCIPRVIVFRASYLVGGMPAVNCAESIPWLLRHRHCLYSSAVTLHTGSYHSVWAVGFGCTMVLGEPCSDRDDPKWVQTSNHQWADMC